MKNKKCIGKDKSRDDAHENLRHEEEEHRVNDTVYNYDRARISVTWTVLD